MSEKIIRGVNWEDLSVDKDFVGIPNIHRFNGMRGDARKRLEGEQPNPILNPEPIRGAERIVQFKIIK